MVLSMGQFSSVELGADRQPCAVVQPVRVGSLRCASASANLKILFPSNICSYFSCDISDYKNNCILVLNNQPLPNLSNQRAGKCSLNSSYTRVPQIRKLSKALCFGGSRGEAGLAMPLSLVLDPEHLPPFPSWSRAVVWVRGQLTGREPIIQMV